MLNFTLQRQTVVTLVGLSFLCMLPMVSALDVRTAAAAESSAPSLTGRNTLHPNLYWIMIIIIDIDIAISLKPPMLCIIFRCAADVDH